MKFLEGGCHPPGLSGTGHCGAMGPDYSRMACDVIAVF